MTTSEVGVLKEMLQGAWWVMLLRGILAISMIILAFGLRKLAQTV